MLNQNSSPQDDLRPKLIPSLLGGFDAVANHIWLIIFPILLDLAIWFAPRLSIQSLLVPLIKSLDALPGVDTKDMQDLIAAARAGWELISQRFNLSIALRTYPVGVPSLMSSRLPVTNPLGTPMVINAPDGITAFGWFVALSLAGMLLAGWYFSLVARSTGKEDTKLTPGLIGWMTLQVLALSLVTVLLVLILGTPAMMLISLLTLINPMIGQVALFLGGLAVIWVVVPLIFSIHGVFALRVPLIKSVLTSIQVVRFTFSFTGLFLMLLVLIGQGMDLLWQVPQDNSWLLLVGIIGHAFINTSLLAASFVYYHNSIKWIQSIMLKNNLAQQSASQVSK